MSRYLDPVCAPRDGTIIIGLFEHAFGKRRISARAAYDVEASDDLRSKASDNLPQWLKEMHATQADRLADDPVSNFRPLDDKPCGRMVGWKPI